MSWGSNKIWGLITDVISSKVLYQYKSIVKAHITKEGDEMGLSEHEVGSDA